MSLHSSSNAIRNNLQLIKNYSTDPWEHVSLDYRVEIGVMDISVIWKNANPTCI